MWTVAPFITDKLLSVLHISTSAAVESFPASLLYERCHGLLSPADFQLQHIGARVMADGVATYWVRMMILQSAKENALPFWQGILAGAICAFGGCSLSAVVCKKWQLWRQGGEQDLRTSWPANKTQKRGKWRFSRRCRFLWDRVYSSAVSPPRCCCITAYTLAEESSRNICRMATILLRNLQKPSNRRETPGDACMMKMGPEDKQWTGGWVWKTGPED